jgi:hypothetical protein
MSRSFYVIEFQTAAGYEWTAPFETLAAARRMRSWYESQEWCFAAAIMQGGPGGQRVN